MNTVRLLGLLFGLSAAMAAAAAEADPPWQSWIERMHKAQRALNFDATVVIDHGSGWEAIELSQRIGANGAEQGMQTLTGPTARLLRSGQGLSLLAAGSDTRLPGANPAAGAIDSSLLARSYRVSLDGVDRVAGREARLLRVVSIDQQRFGMRVWIDTDTGLPLRSERTAADGSVLERQMITRLMVYGFAEGSAVQPAALATLERRDLGSGFLVSSDPGPVPGVEGAQHWVVSDGLARVSIYRIPRAQPGTGDSWQRGALGWVVLQQPGAAIYAIGDLPAGTLRSVATTLIEGQ